MARKPNSLTLIEDKHLEPFFITKDEHCYTVNRKVTSNANHFRSTGKSTTYSKALTFHASFNEALKRITQEQLHDKEHYTSLSDFLDKFKTIETNIKTFLNEKA
jgi:hypothetical protein|tara:strand:+ start:590 stop:901 length:312 start_codon:yes stop_codon:yes gene_type:complete